MSSQDANSLITGTRNALALGGFNLRSFAVNDLSMISSIPPEERLSNEKVLLQESLNRALGIYWMISDDVFFIRGNMNIQILLLLDVRCYHAYLHFLIR